MIAANYSWLLVTAHAVTFAIIAFRVIMRRPPVGAALAWLLLVITLPVVGVLLYLLIGEPRVGQRRASRIAKLHTDYSVLMERIADDAIEQVDWSKHPAQARAMNHLGIKIVGVPTVAGSTGELFGDSEVILRRIVEDIDAARASVLMEFYIWCEGGLADKVVEALIRASRRGVSCRVLVDAVGSRSWWKGSQPAELRAAGVNLLPALPAALWRVLFSRNDLRLHRKAIIIDDQVAWTGSMNLADPRYFKQDSDVAPWVDAMTRIRGAAVAPLAMTIVGDWMIESDESIEAVLEETSLRRVEPQGHTDVQVIPSGPVETSDGILQMLLAIINSAQEELILTTPYFVPDDSLLRAIRGAAGRGVDVHLVLPEKCDSLAARYASRSYFDELMSLGVRIHRFTGGMLHTKSISADRSISMFGTVNLDMRSIWLNYEVSLFVYGPAFGEELRELQQDYLDQSFTLEPEKWSERPMSEKVLENCFRLMSPVL